MKEITLKANKRTETGKKYTKQLRKKGFVPAIVYGNKEPQKCELEIKSLKNIIYTDKVYIINLNIDGNITKCIKKDSQFHPVTDELLHIDFLRVFDDKEVKIYIPVTLTGFAEGVKAGGHIYLLKKYIHVKGLYTNFLDDIILDVTELSIGKSIKVTDLKLPKLEILEPPSEVVVMVKLTRAAMSQTDEDEENEEESTEDTQTKENAE